MQLYSIAYSVPYILLGLFLLCLSSLEKQKNINKAIRSFVFLCVFIFLGLRGHLLTDFENYYPFFQELPLIWNIDEVDWTRFEPGFIIYSSIVKTIYPNYHFWVAVNTFIDLWVFTYVFEKNSKSVSLSWFFFLVFMGLLLEFNLFRNIKAIDLFLLSLTFLQKRRLLPFVLVNLLGMTFHISAILFLPTYFFIYRKFSKQLLIGLFLSICAIYLLELFPTSFIFSKIFGNTPEGLFLKAVRYADNIDAGYGLSFGFLERSCMFLCCICFQDKLQSQNNANIIFINCFYLYFILFHLFADISTFTSRFSYLFIFSYWVIVPNMLAFIKASNKKIVYPIVVLMCLFKLYIATDNILFRYDNVLTGMQTFQERSNIILSYPELKGE